MARRLITFEEHRPAEATHVASGTLACPGCDAPVALSGPVSPAHAMECPYCGRFGAVREFLSLGAPTRPTRVEVVVRRPALASRRGRARTGR